MVVSHDSVQDSENGNTVGKDWTNPKMSIWDLSSLGTEFGMIFIGFIFIGNYIDGRFGSKPIGLLLGLVLGFSAALYHILKRVNDFNSSNKK